MKNSVGCITHNTFLRKIFLDYSKSHRTAAKTLSLLLTKKKKKYLPIPQAYNQLCTLSPGSLNNSNITIYFHIKLYLEGVYTPICQIQRAYLTLYCQILK